MTSDFPITGLASIKVHIPKTLEQIWALADLDPYDSKSNWNDAFDPIGLMLFAPPRNGGYWCTPMNSLAFASTGCNGVHFSLLAVNGAINDFSPVVMTVPMCDTPNVIVGANLKEFLALGCRSGYVGLDQLVYAPHEALENLSVFDPDATWPERRLLKKISSHFNVSPWSDPQRRLQELNDQYASELKLPPKSALA